MTRFWTGDARELDFREEERRNVAKDQTASFINSESFAQFSECVEASPTSLVVFHTLDWNKPFDPNRSGGSPTHSIHLLLLWALCRVFRTHRGPTRKQEVCPPLLEHLHHHGCPQTNSRSSIFDEGTL